MMKEKSGISATKDLIEDIRARQRNTIWPDVLRNGRSVDEFLWKGAPNAPLVQRIGAWIFGLFFILSGLIFLDVAYEKRAIPFGALSVIFIMIGGKVFSNGFRRGDERGPSSE